MGGGGVGLPGSKTCGTLVGMLPFAVLDLVLVPSGRRDSVLVKRVCFIDMNTQKETFFFVKLGNEEGRRKMAENERLLEPSQLIPVLKTALMKYKYIFAKGKLKCSYLLKVLNIGVLDIMKFGCPTFRRLSKTIKIRECTSCSPWTCNTRGPRCHHRQLRLLAQWAHENKDKLFLDDYTVRLSTYKNLGLPDVPVWPEQFRF